MRALAQVTSLSVYSLNLVTGLGLGLAIDYSLFVVYRYREELARCGHCSEALERTLAHGRADRRVLLADGVGGAAVAAGLPQPMLSSMGIAAAIVTVFAATAALIPLGGDARAARPARQRALARAAAARAPTRG